MKTITAEGLDWKNAFVMVRLPEKVSYKDAEQDNFIDGGHYRLNDVGLDDVYYAKPYYALGFKMEEDVHFEGQDLKSGDYIVTGALGNVYAEDKTINLVCKRSLNNILFEQRSGALSYVDSMLKSEARRLTAKDARAAEYQSKVKEQILESAAEITESQKKNLTGLSAKVCEEHFAILG